jgi:hypothetical protein
MISVGDLVTVVDPDGHVHQATVTYVGTVEHYGVERDPPFDWTCNGAFCRGQTRGVGHCCDENLTWARGHLCTDDPQLSALRVAAALSGRRAPVLPLAW